MQRLNDRFGLNNNYKFIINRSSKKKLLNLSYKLCILVLTELRVFSQKYYF